MNRNLARTIAQRHMAQWISGKSHENISALIGYSDTSDVVGPDGKPYQVSISVYWDDKPGGSVRVIASVDNGWLSACFPTTVDELIRSPPSQARHGAS